MAIPHRNVRGVRDIRTLSGRPEKTLLPHEVYMRITCLEMEKARRGKERESAIHRVTSIDARFQEIEAEKVALLAALGGRTLNTARRDDRDGKTPPQSASRRPGDAFRLRY